MKPAVYHPVKKFTTLHDASVSISMFTKNCPCILDWANWIQSIHLQPFKVHFNIILPSIHMFSKRSFLSGILKVYVYVPCPCCVSNHENQCAYFSVLLFNVSCSNILFTILSSNKEYIVWCFLILRFLYRTLDFELNGNTLSPYLKFCKPLISIMLVCQCYFQIL
jgi:hypothetical protein